MILPSLRSVYSPSLQCCSNQSVQRPCNDTLNWTLLTDSTFKSTPVQHHPSTSSASAQAMATSLEWDTALGMKLLLVISLNKINDRIRYDLVAEMMGPGHTAEKDR